jgi:hypothetical protein
VAGLKQTPQGPLVPTGVDARYPNLVQEFPSDTKVEVQRRVHGEDGRCAYVVVKVTDWNEHLAYVSRVDWLSEAPKSATRKAQEVAVAERRVDEEVTSGKCSEAHVDHLRRGMAVLSSYLGSSSQEILELGAHAFAVATETPTPWTLTMRRPGEEHVFAVAFGPLVDSDSFQVLDNQGYAVKTESRLEQLVFAAFNEATRGYVVQANANETLTMKIKGHGCMLLFAVRRY